MSPDDIANLIADSQPQTPDVSVEEDDDSIMSPDDIANLIADSQPQTPNVSVEEDDDDSIMSPDDIANLVANSQENDIVGANQMDILNSQENVADDSILSQDDIQGLLNGSDIDNSNNGSSLSENEISDLFKEQANDEQSDVISQLFDTKNNTDPDDSEAMSNEDIAKMFEEKSETNIEKKPTPKQSKPRPDELNPDEVAAMIKEAEESSQEPSSSAIPSEDKEVDSEIQANRQAQLDALLSTTTNLTEVFEEDHKPKEKVNKTSKDKPNKQFTPPKSKKKKAKNWKKLLVASFVLIACIGGGYSVHQYVQTMKKNSQDKPIQWVLKASDQKKKSSLKARFNLGENKPWGAISIFNTKISINDAIKSIKKHYGLKTTEIDFESGKKIFYIDYSLKKNKKFYLKRTAYLKISEKKTLRLDFITSSENAKDAKVNSNSSKWQEIQEAFDSKFETKLGSVTDESFNKALDFFQKKPEL